MKKGITFLLLLFAVASPVFADRFSRHPTLLRAGPNPSSIVVADLNGDGLPDIVTGDIGRLRSTREEVPAHDQLSLLIATGRLTYEPQPQLKTGFAPYHVVVAKVGHPPAPAIISVNFLATRNRDLSLFQNIGSNNFEPTHFSVPDEDVHYVKMLDGDESPVFTTPGITSIAVEDIDGDGLPDAVATGWASDVLIYFPGNKDHIFGRPKIIPAPDGPRDLVLIDLDGDKKLDIVTTMYDSGEVALWKGNGKGDFYEVDRFITRGDLPHKVRVGDINGDGKIDIAVSHCHGSDSIVLFFGEGKFRFSTSQEIVLGDNREAVEYEIRDFVLSDFNGDGKLDIAAACFRKKQVVVFMNRSRDQSIPQRFRKETYSFKRGKPRALTVADFNQDQKPDLGVALWEANAVALLLGK